MFRVVAYLFSIGALITSVGALGALACVLIAAWMEETGSKVYLIAGFCFLVVISGFIFIALKNLFAATAKM